MTADKRAEWPFLKQPRLAFILSSSLLSTLSRPFASGLRSGLRCFRGDFLPPFGTEALCPFLGALAPQLRKVAG